MTTIGRLLGTALTAAVYVAASPTSVAAQSLDFSIPAGTLKVALRTWERQTGRDLIYREDEVAEVRTRGVRGRMSAESALRTIVEGTGFEPTFTAGGAVALVRQEVEANALPDILVVGKKSWSLNTGIARSRDDSQPFIVMTQEDIQRSGAPDLETFLRNQLNVNNSPSVGDQAGRGEPRQRGLSSINLRGLGARETLILVDGRRQPGVNIGNGQINQPQITGIPLASIDRIEVLASSASGIYGSGATGGVINIILRRDYEGGELAFNAADTSDFAQSDGRIDLTAAKMLEGGRTNISFSASWRDQEPLLYGDREELLARARSEVLANEPDYFTRAAIPAGATPNFRSVNGALLQLKPAFGGALLGSPVGQVPYGYRGLAIDGVAPLLAGIGNYNFDQADSATGVGARAPLLYGRETASATLAVRREFSDWVSGYAELSGSRVWSNNVVTRAPSATTLSANAPNNPFVQAIRITLPQTAAEVPTSSRQDQFRGVVGAIVKLPFEWQSVVDLSWAKGRFVADVTPSNTTTAFNTSLANGSQDVLRDLEAFPLDYQYIDSSFGSLLTPAKSRILNGALKFAGPLPVKMPGGVGRMTLNLEYSNETSDATIAAVNGVFSFVNYTPERTQEIASIYGEVAFPLISETNDVPLIRSLELRVSARHEWYVGTGALAGVSCQSAFGQLPSEDVYADCPPIGTDMGVATTRNSHTDPSISARWSPVQDITFRSSYTTGYLPPRLDQLTRRAGTIYTTARDPERGGELIGIPGPNGYELPGFFGGNTTVEPESSRTLTAGVIVTPRFLTGLRFSADLTRIQKRNNYFDAGNLLFPNDDPALQNAMNIYLAQYPDRVVRGAASGGFAVGPITSLDVSLANLVGSETEAIDFALDYSTNLFGGMIDVAGSATWVRKLEVESFPDIPAVDYTGVVTRGFAIGVGDNGSQRWRGNVSARWTKGPLSLGWQGRYFDSYFLMLDRSVVVSQGSPKVDSQFYHDVSAAYTFTSGLTGRFGINNVLGKEPPLDTTASPLFYSRYGDPRLTSFYLTLAKTF